MVQTCHGAFYVPVGWRFSSSRRHRSASREACPQKHAGAGAAPSDHEPACTQRKNRRRYAWLPLRVPPVAHRPAPHAIEQTAAPLSSPRATSRQGGFAPRSGPGRCRILPTSLKRLADFSLRPRVSTLATLVRDSRQKLGCSLARACLHTSPTEPVSH